MEKHLKESIQENLTGDISPLSPIDAEIIVELKEIINKHGLSDLSRIISEWKNLDDEEVRDLLIDYGINHNFDSEEEGEGKKPYRNFILFENISLDIHFISSIGRGKYFNFQTGTYEYLIKINEHTGENSIHHNLVIKFESEEEMFNKYAELLELLKDTKTINFY